MADTDGADLRAYAGGAWQSGIWKQARVIQHQQNPFVMLAGKQTGEDAGECYGCMLLYSGNFKAEAEKDQYEQTRLVMGLSDEMFSWKLEPGETFDTPETAF